MSIFLPTHMEILPPAQRLGFVLYGGTAIALRLGHRSSVDFDFFTADPLKKNLRHWSILKAEIWKISTGRLENS
jgi:hypothetical protein